MKDSYSSHLYQHGVDLTLISQWLGHANLETTLVYARADTEQKRRAMENANKSSPLAEKLNSVRFKVNDDKLLYFFCSHPFECFSLFVYEPREKLLSDPYNVTASVRVPNGTSHIFGYYTVIVLVELKS